jgi:sigma-54 dependent transcriptional regulator, acetoin dehydrogenase operon transcriptional activator AcoR
LDAKEYKDKLYIDVSHERCRGNGLDPNSVFSAKLLTGDEFQRKLDKSKELVLIATPFMDQLYNFVKGSDFFVLITDEEGCILSAMGDDSILSEAFELKMIPGAFMDEESIGTNAMSVVISEQVPVQVSGKEHFVNAYHKWTCSAAPIRDIDGKIIGILDLTGYLQNVHPHTLGMVAAASNAIEKMLQINKYNSDLTIAKKNTEVIFNSISSGILTSDLEGNILTMNSKAIEMFGNINGVLSDKKMWETIEGWSNVIEKLYTKGCFTDEDVYVNTKINKLQYTLTAYPVYDANKNILQIIHVFSETRKGRKLAGKILSGQAIYTFDKILGKNEKFLKIVEYAKKIADSKSTVLLSGESGTGKEIFAQSIHNFSNRNEEPFIAVNCGAIPRTLIESELFGYEEGSFTGAKKGGVAGKFELADGGTIFLDEIGEMPFDMQIKLLRVIEEGVINRIGNGNPISVNVRIIAATNKDLKQEVEKGNFRKDLFYRLNVLPITLPPLRERRDDIHLLLDYYMNKTSKRLNKKMVYVSNEQRTSLINYNWPGNIRELENIIELIINTESVPLDLLDKSFKEQENTVKFDASLTLDQVERNHITRVLMEFNGNIRLAAKNLDIGRNTLYRKLEKYGINCSEFEPNSIMEQL